MKACLVPLFSMLLAACATPPVAPQTDRLFNDHLFHAPSERISADDVFAVSAAMKHFVHTEIADQLHDRGYQHGFADALQTKGQLKLEYDSAMTRNASQAFDARGRPFRR